MELFAHRGNSGEAPENTLAAFRQALDAGADGVEFDVQSSRDGVPIVIHDERLGRTVPGTGWVRDHTLAELKALDAGRWFSPAFAGERIPTLQEVLDLVRGTPLRLNIELKTNRVAYPGLARQVVEMVQRLGLGPRAHVSSFNHKTLREARALAPQLEYAAVVYEQLVQPWAYARQWAFRALHPSLAATDEETVRGCHEAGLKVRVWVVDEPEDYARMEAWGVDAVISNHPRRFGRRA
jgi:glycerophosphoryl diester phosphodiesterase